MLGTADDVLRMIETGDLVLSLVLAKEVSPIRALILKCKDQSMALGMLVVRLAELLAGSVVY